MVPADANTHVYMHTLTERTEIILLFLRNMCVSESDHHAGEGNFLLENFKVPKYTGTTLIVTSLVCFHILLGLSWNIKTA